MSCLVVELGSRTRSQHVGHALRAELLKVRVALGQRLLQQRLTLDILHDEHITWKWIDQGCGSGRKTMNSEYQTGGGFPLLYGT